MSLIVGTAMLLIFVFFIVAVVVMVIRARSTARDYYDLEERVAALVRRDAARRKNSEPGK